jgi:hypothetical protein
MGRGGGMVVLVENLIMDTDTAVTEGTGVAVMVTRVMVTRGKVGCVVEGWGWVSRDEK